MLIDDELFTLWSQFAAGVRIVVVSDSCHSGTVVRAMYERLMPGDGGHTDPYRLLDPVVAQEVFEKMTSCYEPIKWGMRGDRVSVSASVILLSGCQDNQLSGDGPGNGLFTSKLLEVWNNGKFSGTYSDFMTAIRKKMPFSQTPNLYKTGAANSSFDAQKPFSKESPRFIPEGGNGQSDNLTFTLNIDRSFVESMSDNDLTAFLRTSGADTLVASYHDWKEATSRLSSAIATRGSWEVKCETNTKTGETKCSGSIGGSF